MKVYKFMFHICAMLKLVFLKIIYGKKLVVGKGVTWRKRFDVMLADCAKVYIGDNCFFNNDCSINSMDTIVIGEGTIFGEGVKIYDHNHRFNDFERSIKEQGFSIASVKIGKHCWIGSNVVITKGSIIGDNCVIGAGVVVRGEISEGTIVKQDAYGMEKVQNRIDV